MTRKLVISVQHSGTRFLKTRLGIEHHVHTSTSWDTLWSNVQGCELYAPLRKPKDVWRSWCRRQKDDPMLWAPHFYHGFFMMHTLDMLLDIEFIPVDLCQHPYISDWSPVGHDEQSRPEWRLHKTDMRVLYKLPFIVRHYGSHS